MSKQTEAKRDTQERRSEGEVVVVVFEKRNGFEEREDVVVADDEEDACSNIVGHSLPFILCMWQCTRLYVTSSWTPSLACSFFLLLIVLPWLYPKH
jgi:hypothetical protein